MAANAAANNQPAYIRARQEAEEADKEYRVAVRKLDRQRLGLEERIEDTLKTLQRWETERLRAVKTGKQRSDLACVSNSSLASSPPAVSWHVVQPPEGP